MDVPKFLIDNELTRSDIADFLFEIEWFDKNIGLVLNHLGSLGKPGNTFVIVTSDNGMPFPRAKSNLYG
ncbi:MAG TPA: hypothetical protein DDY13_14875 [Cytophagales bacterium]|nr:hypothetical protein [Cytophagales bacterium]